MVSKFQLVDRLKETRAVLVSAIAAIDPETGITPEWTVKEVLAHIAGWDDVSTEAIRILAEGGEPQVTVPQGIDAFNQDIAEGWAGKEYQQALQDFTQSRQRFIEAIETIPEKMIMMEFTLPWGPKGTIKNIVDILAEHELEHAEQLNH